MAEVNSDIERRIAQVDAQTPSPQERAQRVWNIVAPIISDQCSVWDMVCFCANYLGMLTPELPFLHEDARKLNRLIYSAHYFAGEHHDDGPKNREHPNRSDRPKENDARPDAPGRGD